MDKIVGKSKKKGVYITLLTIAALLILLVLVPYFSYRSFLNSPISRESREIEFQVRKGANSTSIIESLHKKGLIKNTLFAKLYLRNLHIDKSLRAGIYKFNTSMTPVEIFKKLKSGAPDIDVVTVTFPEGYNVKQIAEKLRDSGLVKSSEDFIKETQEGTFDYEFLKDIPKDRPHKLEGYLFPDTYEFKKNVTEHDIVVKMLDRFKQVYDANISGNIKDNKYSVDDIIIMASIVEREAKIDSERPLMAAVFYNRLKINMGLQSCATIQYALGYNKEKLLNKDLEIESPYNTYKYAGLPAGPICSPGKSSILAALKPADVDYLYFVLKAYNGDGSHNFARDYNEFLKYKSQLK